MGSSRTASTRFKDLLDDDSTDEQESHTEERSQSEEELEESQDDSGESDDSSLSLSLPSLDDMFASTGQQYYQSGQSPQQAEYERHIRDSVRKLKHAKKKLQKRNKKKKRKTETVFRYLMKAVESYQLPVLDYKPQPSRRRGAFLRFMDKLKLVTSSVGETRNMLADSGNPKAPSNKAANRAMFRVLCSRVDTYLVSQLHELQARRGHEDGFGALMLLRSLFADAEDVDYKISVLNEFQAVKLHETESVFDFSKRFGFLYRAVVGSGQGVPEKERIRYYLRALREHREPRILYEIKERLADHKKGKRQVLQTIQQELIREEEQVKGTSSGQVHDQTIIARHGNRRQRPVRQANFSSSKPK